MINLISCLMLNLGVLSPYDVSYSSLDNQNIPLDHKIAKRIGKVQGIFIEVGAYDGVVQSNTKLLEECYDWTGVLIEPSLCLYKKLVGNRPRSKCFQCALSSPEQNDTYLYGDFDGALMSSVHGNRRHHLPLYRVPVRTLQSILDEVNLQHIDFFSLDVEGYELNVLKGIDFNKTSFDYILIEIYSSFYDQIIEFLDSYGYKMVENFSNYTHEENPDWDGTHNDYLFERIGLKKSTEVTFTGT